MEEVRIIRSAQRRRTVSATIENGVMVLRVPARFTRQDELEWIERMRKHFEKKRRRVKSDSDLMQRARVLNHLYFGGRLRFSVQWVDNQTKRWGSCTPCSESIRISRELEPFPEFVLDYVLVHELAHLIVPDHSDAFWKLVRQYPDTDKAIGFLMGVSTARALSPAAG